MFHLSQFLNQRAKPVFIIIHVRSLKNFTLFQTCYPSQFDLESFAVMSQSSAGNLIVIGICGVTCGGKTTVATKLCNILPNCKLVSQDDYFLDEDDPRHIWIPELNHVNYDIITSLDMDQMYEDLILIMNNHKLNGKFEASEKTPLNLESREYYIPYTRFRDANVSFLIVEGFSIFNFKPIVSLFDLKYYFVMDKESCFKRRIDRVYEPPDCPGYFEKCAWPEHLAQLKEVQNTVSDVYYHDANSELDIITKILADINVHLDINTQKLVI